MKKVKKASSFIFAILRIIFRPVLYLKYRFKFEMKTSKGIKKPCLILSNHQTSFDQFAVSLGFKFGINFIASDSIFRHGFLSFLMKLLVRPIPFSKGSPDPTAVKNIVSVIKQGGAVAMFPSGNRSIFGEESPINPAVGRLAKSLNVPLVLVRMYGGFNTKPRWKAKPSKGKVRAGVVRILSPEELKALPDFEINKIINQELKFNEFEFNKKAGIIYRGKHKAEYLESVLFFCPNCKSLNTLKSFGNEFFCIHCGASVRINDTGFFEKIKNETVLPEAILEWSKKQLEHIKTIDYSQFLDKPLFYDNDVSFSKVIRAKRDILLGKGRISLYADKIIVCGKEIPIIKINDMALQGSYRLMIYSDEGTFSIDIKAPGNLLKYMICGYHLKNTALNTKEEFYGY